MNNKKFITTECKRGCGKMLTSLSRSMGGIDKLRQKYQFICGECLTRKERDLMLHEMGKSIQHKIINRG